MKIVRYRKPSGDAGIGVVEDDVVYDAGDSLTSPVKGEPVGRIGEVSLLAPVDGHGKVVCIGLNYVDHAEETGQAIPETPTVFGKFGNAVIGDGETIRIPSFVTQTDYEAELGVVIARRASDVSVDDALDHVLGYTCVNDVSARDLQFDPTQSGQWLLGKTPDTYCPTGPWIVTADEIPDPQTLSLRLSVNGTTLQESSTKHMIKSVAELVSFVSRVVTLEPGDLIATGTPGGVGFKRTPPVYLKPGDTVTMEIEGVGTLTNPVAARES